MVLRLPEAASSTPAVEAVQLELLDSEWWRQGRGVDRGQAGVDVPVELGEEPRHRLGEGQVHEGPTPGLLRCTLVGEHG